MSRHAALLAGLALGVGAWWLWQRRAAGDLGYVLAVDMPADSVPADVVETVSDWWLKGVTVIRGQWDLPAAGEPYRALIEAAEDANGIPRMLLGRLLYQESHFRPDIITGATRSSAGALGIAQFMPATAADLRVDPLDTAEAIPGAARYLRALYNATGDWGSALAAYNWGIGNVQRRGLDAAPAETRQYIADILGDTGYA